MLTFFYQRKKTALACLLFTASLAAILWGCHSQNNTSSEPDADPEAGESYLHVTKLSPDAPHDVDTALEHTLIDAGKFDETNRLFDVWAWQTFIALNWPLEADGKPKSSISDEGKRKWEFWKESFEVFKDDGSKPTVWGGKKELSGKLGALVKKPAIEDTLILFRTSAVSGLVAKTTKKGHRVFVRDTADEVNQAFTSPIWDQHGNEVRYEIRMGRQEVEYIVQNELYNIDGQVKFSKAGNKVNFPSGDVTKEGSIELKLAWKILVKDVDDPNRYLSKPAYVYENDGSFHLAQVGLIGMHIAAKTVSSPQWMWATFEQVDNLETNPLEKVNGKPLQPSFYDPSSLSPVNLIPDTTAKVIKNQIQRVLPIPGATAALNKQVRALLKTHKSFLQYYQLIGTQWPTRPSAAPYSDTSVYKLPDAVVNKAGGYPTPTYLTNMIMETYFQGATTSGSNPLSAEEVVAIQKALMTNSINKAPTTGTTYNYMLGNEPAFYQMPNFPKNKDISNTHTVIFGTESCVGCHSSAGIASDIIKTSRNTDSVVYNTATAAGDFEWLLQLKAHRKRP